MHWCGSAALLSALLLIGCADIGVAPSNSAHEREISALFASELQTLSIVQPQAVITNLTDRSAVLIDLEMMLRALR